MHGKTNVLTNISFTEPINSEPRRRIRRNLNTARQTAINLEVDARIQKLNSLTKQEKEIHEMRKREAELKIEIQEEILKKSRIETESASMKFAYEKEIWKIRLDLEKKTAEVSFKDFLKDHQRNSQQSEHSSEPSRF